MLLAIAQQLGAQSADVIWDDSLHVYERKLVVVGDSLLHSKSQFTRQESAKQLIRWFRHALLLPGSYSYPFDSLTYMSKLRPSDNAFRLFSWVLRLDGNRFRYFGVIHLNTPAGDIIHPLFDRSVDELPQAKDGLADSVPQMANLVYDNNNWQGMLYFKMGWVHKKSGFLGLKKSKYYMLLGWDGNNNISHKKIVDVLYFDGEIPVFGAPIIALEDGSVVNRMILEYNAQAVVTLKWHEGQGAISFDDLVPPNPKNEGDYFTYIPSGRYNYLHWNKRVWTFKKDVFDTLDKELMEAQ